MEKDVKAVFKPEYLVRKDKQGTHIVTKWEGGERPTAIYTVTENNRGMSCNCPGSHRDKNCKHIQLVKEHMKKKTESSIGKWSQDGKMHSFTYVMKDDPTIKALIFDNSAKQLAKPNEIVIELHFENGKVLETRDFSWKRVEVLKDLVQNLFRHLYKNPPQDEQSLERLLKSSVQRVISKTQLVEACKEANIEIRDGKIAKADLEKIMAKYNPHGEVNDYGFGNQDLSHPVYHDEGRLMGWNSDVRTKTDLKTFIAGLKKLLLDAERADSKGANLVVVNVSSTSNNSGYLSAVFYDVNDTLEEYRKFVEKFKAEKGREPRLSEIKY